ncbi:MAG: hypothetical protein ACI4J7_11475 [Ruminiclostridium sp.]
MGQGYHYECSRCGNKFRVIFGSGFGYCEALSKETDKIRKGKYGKRWKQLIESEKEAVPDLDFVVFYCDNCGKWKNERDLSLYKPVSQENESDSDKLTFFLPDNKSYALLEEYTYHCEKCGSKMKKLTYETIDKLECPECGELCDKYGYVDWD